MSAIPTDFCIIYPVVLYRIKSDGCAAVNYNKFCWSRLFMLHVAVELTIFRR